MSGNPAKPSLGPSVQESKRSASTLNATDHPTSSKRHKSWEQNKEASQRGKPDKHVQPVPQELHGQARSTNGQPATSVSSGLRGQSPEGAKEARLLPGSKSKPASSQSQPPDPSNVQKPEQPGASWAPARPQRTAGMAAKRSLASLAAAERTRGCLKAARIASLGLPANNIDAHTPQVPARTIIQASTSTAPVASPKLLVRANNSNIMHNTQGGTAGTHNCLPISSAQQAINQQQAPQQHLELRSADAPLGSQSNALAGATFQFCPGLPLVQQLSPNQLACCISPCRAANAAGTRWLIPTNVAQTFFAGTDLPRAPGMPKCHFSIMQADGSGALAVNLSCYLNPQHKQPVFYLCGLTQYTNRHQLQAGDLVLITRSADAAQFTISHQRTRCTDGSGHSLYSHQDIKAFLQCTHSRRVPSRGLVNSDSMSWCITPCMRTVCTLAKYSLSTVFRDLHSQLPKTPKGKHCSFTLTEQDGSRVHAAVACHNRGPQQKHIYRLNGLPQYLRKHGLQAGDVITITRTAPKKFSISHKLKTITAPPTGNATAMPTALTPGNASAQPTAPPSKTRMRDQKNPPTLAGLASNKQTGRAKTGQTHASRTQATAALPGRQSVKATQPANSPVNMMPSAQHAHRLSDTAAHATGSKDCLLPGLRDLLPDSAPGDICDPQRFTTVLERQTGEPSMFKQQGGTAQAELASITPAQAGIATSTPADVDTNMTHAANLLIRDTADEPALCTNPSTAAVQEDTPWSNQAACQLLPHPLDDIAQPEQHTAMRSEQQQPDAMCVQSAMTDGQELNLNTIFVKAEPADNAAGVPYSKLPDMPCNDTQMGETKPDAPVGHQLDIITGGQAAAMAGRDHRHAAAPGRTLHPSCHADVICVGMSDDDDAADHGHCGPSARLPAQHGPALAERPAPSSYHDAALRPANIASVKTAEETDGDCAADPPADAPIGLHNKVTGHRAQSMPIQLPKLETELLFTSPTSTVPNGKAGKPTTADHAPRSAQPVAVARTSGSPLLAAAPAALDSTAHHDALSVPIAGCVPESTNNPAGLAKPETLAVPMINSAVSAEPAAVDRTAQHGVPCLPAAGGKHDSWKPRATAATTTTSTLNAEPAVAATILAQDHAPSLQATPASAQLPSAAMPAAGAAPPSTTPVLPHDNRLTAQAFAGTPQADAARCRYSSDTVVAQGGAGLPALTAPAAPPAHAAGMVLTVDETAPGVAPALTSRQNVPIALAPAPAAQVSAQIATSCATITNLPPHFPAASPSGILQCNNQPGLNGRAANPVSQALPNCEETNLAAAQKRAAAKLYSQRIMQQSAVPATSAAQAPPVLAQTRAFHATIDQPAMLPDVSGLSGVARQRALERGVQIALDTVNADQAIRQTVDTALCKMPGDVDRLKAFVEWQYPSIMTAYESKDTQRLRMRLESIFNLAGS